MSEELVLVGEKKVSLGVINGDSAAALVTGATDVAKQLASVIDGCNLFNVISGRKFVRVEGWTTLAAMMGVSPREVSVLALEDGSYEAIVELVRHKDGMVISRGSALCGSDESTWGSRPRYARRSMAITRATGKACRLAFSWVMGLAGYEPCPAEEMDGIDIEARHVENAPHKAVPEPAMTKGGKKITEPQQKRLFAISRANGWNDVDMKALLRQYGYNASKDIPMGQAYDWICGIVEKGPEAWKGQESNVQDVEPLNADEIAF